MTRAQFMEKLKNLLSDIPEWEREEALNYYEDYFDDAGVENEAQVIAALGSPEKVARTIREGLADHTGEQGEFSETGYSGYGEADKDEVVTYGTSEKESFKKRIRQKGNGGMILLLILAIFALPVLGPVIVGIGGALLGILTAVVVVMFALTVVGIALLVAGAVTFAASIGCIFIKPAVAAMLFGLSLLLIGVGILITILGIWVATKAVPPVIRGIVKGIRKIFKKKEE